MFTPDNLSRRQADALAYWRDLYRQRAGLPARSDVDPAAMTAFLSRVTLVDVVPGPDTVRYRARLIGTAVVLRHGRDITGRFDDELYKGAYLAQLRRFYDRVREERQPLLVECRVHGEYGNRRYSRLVLPLSGDGESVDMLMVVFAYDPADPGGGKPLPAGQSQWQVTELDLPALQPC